MSDYYQEVEETSWGTGYGSSCVGVFAGIIFFLASFSYHFGMKLGSIYPIWHKNHQNFPLPTKIEQTWGN